MKFGQFMLYEAMLSWFSVYCKMQKTYMCNAFFSGILAQKTYDTCVIFCQFSDVKNGRQSQQPSVLCQLVSSEPSALELLFLRKANLIFQWISLSNATLLLIVFFACSVHKLDCILFNQKTKFLSTGFFQGGFIQSEKVELKTNYTKWS